jgi:O-acetyl-ADP-ribose deacetylase (regulator of RNase III)
MPTPLKSRIQIIQGDITRLHVEAIVNAANESLLGGGGVDGAIHRAAGPALLAECRKFGGCPTGQAKITAGHNLPARHIIHTVGPIYDGGGCGEVELLASCYHESLRLAADNNLHSIAFPCISTGVYSYPKPEACRTALSTVTQWLAAHDLPETVTFCCFEREDTELYRAALTNNA